MVSYLRCSCLATLFLVLKCQEIPAKQEEDSSRIVGGSRARPGQFPFAVSLQIYRRGKPQYHTCTLSLITARTSLGAAHCAVGERGKKRAKIFCGIVGSVIQSSDSTCHTLSRIIVHEQYESTNITNDIALFIFKESMELDGKFVDTIPLIASTKFGSRSVTAIGWGNLHTYDEEDLPKILRYVNLRLLPGERCYVDDKQLCIETVGKGICAGDSGGPNIISVPKQIQVGISSYIQDECAEDFSVSVAVGTYTEWIKKNTVGEPTFVDERNFPKLFMN